MEYALSIEPTRVPQWLAPDTNQLGLHHGRVHFNCVCGASSGVRIRMRNAARVPRLTLRFLNADSREERTVVVDASNDDTFWSHDRLAVPFVDRPVGDEPADVSVTITNPAYALPLYEHGGNVAPADFKRSWRDSVSPYALVDIGNTAFLVPPADKELVTADAFDLIRLRDHYESIYRHYENAIVVSDSPTAPAADRVYARQFFCKADAGSGAGIAFYGQHWIGASANTLLRYLNVDADPWLILHEIGHGHEFAFVGTAPPLIEVWTNILPNLFQFDTMTSAERQTAAWIYDHGRREVVERGLGALIDQRELRQVFVQRAAVRVRAAHANERRQARLPAHAPPAAAFQHARRRTHRVLNRRLVVERGRNGLLAPLHAHATKSRFLLSVRQGRAPRVHVRARAQRVQAHPLSGVPAVERFRHAKQQLRHARPGDDVRARLPGAERRLGRRADDRHAHRRAGPNRRRVGGAVRRLALGVRGGRGRGARAVRFARARRRVRPARAARSRPALRHHHTR
uniref:VEF-2 n=1 Tax=Lymantria dispar multicapsid nuclear polyhedrosis virus TaxID=10449 RepID=A0A140HRM1_NPVLD|nr:VEF-2 [Lymantria dispar multiple nucleopolyhedrovirus]